LSEKVLFSATVILNAKPPIVLFWRILALKVSVDKKNVVI